MPTQEAERENRKQGQAIGLHSQVINFFQHLETPSSSTAAYGKHFPFKPLNCQDLQFSSFLSSHCPLLLMAAYSGNHMPSGCPSRLLVLPPNIKLNKTKHTCVRTSSLSMLVPVSENHCQSGFHGKLLSTLLFYATISDSRCKYSPWL